MKKIVTVAFLGLFALGTVQAFADDMGGDHGAPMGGPAGEPMHPEEHHVAPKPHRHHHHIVRHRHHHHVVVAPHPVDHQ